MASIQPKLQKGDEIRVIAPSMSWHRKQQAAYERAVKFLESQGFVVSFGRNVKAEERFGTGPVEARLQDLHDAYADAKVKAIIALGGGWSANALLPGIDWELLRRNPKPLIGFSDITVLVNAVFAMTGTVNYLGPNFSGLGRRKGSEYSRENLLNVLTGSQPPSLVKSRQWLREDAGPLVKTRPWKVLQAGTAEGTLVGGNIGTFYLLQGTPYQPRLDRPIILAVEDDDEAGKNSAREFDRRLESLLQLPGMRENLRGVLVGRFQPSSGVTLPDVAYILTRMQLGGIPIMYDLDFGHTWPMMTLPIGGEVQIRADNNLTQVNLLKW